MAPLPSLTPPCQAADPFLLIFMTGSPTWFWMCSPPSNLSLRLIVVTCPESAGAKTSPVPARDMDRLAGDPAGLGRRQEDCHRADIAGLADAAKRRLRLDLLSEVAAGDPRRVHAFGLDHAGVERVDTDLARPQFLGERPRHGVHRGLGAAVDGSAGKPRRSGHRADVDEPAARGT